MANALKLLRSDPERAFKSYVFMTGNAAQGGSCAIGCAKVIDNVVKLTPDFGGGGDYFFRYGLLAQAPGTVTVPVGQPDGTIVFTGGMNGCALQVQRTGAGFVFYHDVNCQQLTGPVAGNTVCRVEPKDYDRFDRGGTVSIEVNHGRKNSGYFQFAMITVHHAGKWKVFANCIITETDNTTGKLSRAYTITTAPAAWMGSFDDA